MSSKVYIIHNIEDKLAAEVLAERLTSAGIDPWLAPWNLSPDAPWQAEMENSLVNCDACIFLIGPNRQRLWLHEAFPLAIARRRRDRPFRLLPVLLPNAERGKRGDVPSFLALAAWIEFRDSLDNEVAFEKLLNGIRQIAPGAHPVEPPSTQCPYPGLRYFDIDDAPYFFGREALTDWLVSDVRRMIGPSGEPRFLALVGTSGSGKSSLARAGLLRALKDSAIDGSAEWPLIVVDHPGSDPIDSLIRTGQELLGLSAERIDSIVERIKTDLEYQRELQRLAELALSSRSNSAKLVVFVDQFEEIFTGCQSASLRQRFVEMLLNAASSADGKVIVMIAVRADFVGRCADIPELAAAISRGIELVGTMTDSEIESAIVCPAAVSGISISPDLVTKLIEEVHKHANSLPLLGYALKEMWENKQDNAITEQVFSSRIGHFENALSRRGDQILQSCGKAAQQKQILDLLTRLVHISDSDSGSLYTSSCVSVDHSEYVLLAPFSQAHFLVTDAGQHGTATMACKADHHVIALVHESLTQHWSTLRKSLQNKSELRNWKQSIHFQYEEWRQGVARDFRSQSQRALLNGPDLKRGRAWNKRFPEEFSEEERRFLQASAGSVLKQRLKAGMLVAASMMAIAMITVLIWWQDVNKFGLDLMTRALFTRIGLYPAPPSPPMQQIEPGNFVMGTTETDMKAGKSELPPHPVRIGEAFAISRFEVTFEEYDAFVTSTGHRRPDDYGWGRGKQPVVDVTWDDAVAYAEWLSFMTGKSYRLPTEAEWEYAARGGDAAGRGNQETRYGWGDEMAPKNAQCIQCQNQLPPQPLPVGSFSPNAAGLYDMSGNVWEWVQDCFHADYAGAPGNGAEWNDGSCDTNRVIRGGSWNSVAVSVRSAHRGSTHPGSHDSRIGFRLAQDL